MNKIILIIVVAISLFGCRSKKSIIKSVDKSESTTTSINIIDTSKVERKVLEVLEIEFNDAASDSSTLKLALPNTDIKTVTGVKKIKYTKFAEISQQNAISVSKDSVSSINDIVSKEAHTKDYGWTSLIVIIGLILLIFVIVKLKL